jgi:hypothetical protein
VTVVSSGRRSTSAIAVSKGVDPEAKLDSLRRGLRPSLDLCTRLVHEVNSWKEEKLTSGPTALRPVPQ